MRGFIGIALLGAVVYAPAACSSSKAGGGATGVVTADIGKDASVADAGSVTPGVANPDGSADDGGSVTPGVVDDDASVDGGPLVTYGQPYTGGQYNLGPVDYAETDFHNACAPSTKYDPRVQAVEGTLLAGLWNGIALWGGVTQVAGFCDACIWVTTPTGKSAMLRVVTYGDTTTNSIDTSQTAYDILNTNEYPRAMTWQFAKCPDTGPMLYEFQTESSQYWTSLWVRNARVPVSTVEVMSANHATWTLMTRGTDGTLTDSAGFGEGPFSIRTTGVDGTQVVDMFPWPSSGIAGAFLTGAGNFP
jgi:expansin (peptidoglycan-binding protein)